MLRRLLLRTAHLSAAAEAQARLSQMLPMTGVTITQTTPGRIDGSLTVKREPNWIVVVLLVLLWIIPGLIYWYVASRPMRAVQPGIRASGHGDTYLYPGWPEGHGTAHASDGQLPWHTGRDHGERPGHRPAFRGRVRWGFETVMPAIARH